MGRNGFLRIVLCAVFALALTGGAYLWDRGLTEGAETDQALKLARQVATQVESMTLTARERGESDPLAWSVSYLTQGVEPRVIRIAVVESAPAQGDDNYRLDRIAGTFDYVKTIDPQDGRGVKIHLDTGFSGYLGSRTAFGNDFELFATWCLLFANFFLGTRRRKTASGARREKRIDQPELDGEVPMEAYEPLTADKAPEHTPVFEPVMTAPKPAPEPAAAAPTPPPAEPASVVQDDLRPRIVKWVGEARGVLLQLGTHVRDVLKEANALAHASQRSLDSVTRLRARLHSELTGLHASRQALKESQRAVTLAQAISIQAMTEAQRLGPQGRAVVRMAEQLDRLMKEIQKQNQRTEKAVKQFEVELEPLVTDADLAFEAHHDAQRATAGLSECVDQAKVRLLGQAKLIQTLNEELRR